MALTFGAAHFISGKPQRRNVPSLGRMARKAPQYQAKPLYQAAQWTAHLANRNPGTGYGNDM